MTVLTLDYICMKRSKNPTGIGQQNKTAADTMSIGTSPRRTSSSSSNGSSARAAAAGSVAKRPGKRPGRKPSKVDEHAKLERSRQSARECRARKKLRYQYLEELVLNREKAVFALRDELETLKQWCLQMDSDVTVPDALLKVLVSEDLRTQRRQRQGDQQGQLREQQKLQQQEQQQQHEDRQRQMDRWLSSSSSASDSPPQKMSLQQQQQVQRQQWHHQRHLQQQQHLGVISDQQGTSQQQQHSRHVAGLSSGSGSILVAGTRTPPPLKRQMAVDIPHTTPLAYSQPRTVQPGQFSNMRQHSSDSLFEQKPSIDLTIDTSHNMPLTYTQTTPTGQRHRLADMKHTSTDSVFQHQNSTDSLFENTISQFRERSLSNPLNPRRFSPTNVHITSPNTTVPAQSLELFSGNPLTNALSNSISSIPSVKLTSPVEEIDSSDDNEVMSQPLFQSSQRTISDPTLQSLSHPSPRPLTPSHRFPSPTPLKSSSPFDPHAKLRRLTNVHCYSATRTSNTPSPSPYNAIPLGIEMTPSPSSYRTCTTPSSSATPSPAPLMSLNTFLDISGSSLSSAVTDLTDDTTGSDATLPNFLFSQQTLPPMTCASNMDQTFTSTGLNASISEPIPQFYSFLADLQDVEMSLNSRQSASSGHGTPMALTPRPDDQIPTPDSSTLNLPTIINDFLNNTHNTQQ